MVITGDNEPRNYTECPVCGEVYYTQHICRGPRAESPIVGNVSVKEKATLDDILEILEKIYSKLDR